MTQNEMKVTPWEVEGKVDYDRLIKQFGVMRLDAETLKRFEKLAGGTHFQLTRGNFFAHRDLNWLMNEYEKKEKFYLYTGRGPSENTHLGHLIPWTFTKWLQDQFKVDLYFQVTNDEKFLFKKNLSLEQATKFAYENILDIIALGFDPKKTKIFIDTEYAKTLYPQAIRVAKHITNSTTKAVFGFSGETNIGLNFYTSMQAVPAFLGSLDAGKNVPCLIPLAVDQDPHFRVTRDILPKLGYYKPAEIISKFLPGLGPGGKMSASDPNSTVYTTDDEKTIRAKIARAFTGQQATRELQKKLGGNPDICSVCQFYWFFFEPNDKKANDILRAEKEGTLMAGEHKADLADLAVKFMAKHQEAREKAKDKLDKYMLRD